MSTNENYAIKEAEVIALNKVFLFLITGVVLCFAFYLFESGKPLDPSKQPVVSPDEVVSHAKEWLARISDTSGMGDMVRTVVRYDTGSSSTYLVIASPNGWMTFPGRKRKHFMPSSSGTSKMDQNRFESSPVGDGVRNARSEIVYDDPDADKPRLRIYRGIEEAPYDKKVSSVTIDYHWPASERSPDPSFGWRDDFYLGTPSNDVFVAYGGRSSHVGVRSRHYTLVGNGGSDIYDVTYAPYWSMKAFIVINKTHSSDKNIIYHGDNYHWGGENGIIPVRRGDDLVLIPSKSNPEAGLFIKNWYLGARHRFHSLRNGEGQVWTAEEIEALVEE